MEKMKEAIAKIAPYVLCWIMLLITYFMKDNVVKGFEALIAMIDVFK